METLSRLQQRLCLSKRDAEFEHAHLVEWSAEFLKLFWIDEERAEARFIGTPTTLRWVLDELLILAWQCGVDMEKAVWGKYPNLCSYCLTQPCLCGPRKSGPHKHLNTPPPSEGLALGNLQRMLGNYTPTILLYSRSVWMSSRRLQNPPWRCGVPRIPAGLRKSSPIFSLD